MSTNISTIGQNIFIRAQIQNLQNQMNVLQDQVSSGKKSNVYSGINDVASLSLQLNNAKQTTVEFQDNITNARLRIQPIQTVLQQITDLANQIRNDALVASSDALPTAKGNGALKAQAQTVLNEISALLNTKVGNDYLFGGRNAATPPMPSFGRISDASSMLGQVAGLNLDFPLGLNAASGDLRYDQIKSFINNGLTKVTSTGARAPSPFGYAGESGQPGGSAYRFTIPAGANVGDTAVVVAQGFDLPAVGQYVEFGIIPPQNAAYVVTAVNSTTRQIDFARVPAGGALTGLDFAIPANTSMNVTVPAVVTTVEPSSAFTTGAAAPTVIGAAPPGSVTVDITNAANDYGVGNIIQFSNDTTSTYRITAIAGTTLTIVNTAIGGGGLVVGHGGTETIAKYPGGAFGTGAVGDTSLRVQNIGDYEVGDRVEFQNDPGVYYDVIGVDDVTGTINFVQSGNGSGGLINPVNPGDTTTILQGYRPGTTLVNVGSNTGVTPGMVVKFSNSATIYTVVRTIGIDQVEISAESTSNGSGLEDPLFSPLTGPGSAPGIGMVSGTDITAQFGNRIDPLKVRIDDGVDLEYGIRADNPAIRTILNGLFALATIDLNSTTEGGFREVAIRAAEDLARGSQLMTDLAAELGVKENTLDGTETRHKDFQVVIETQLDRVENVDMAEAVSRLTQTQTNLQASYQLLASLRNLSLANFL